MGDISEGWAVAWVAYSAGTGIPTVFAVLGLHSPRFDRPTRAVIAATWFIFVGFAWAMLVTILIDNCGAGGDCDPYKGIHGWPSGKAALAAALPFVAAGLGTEAFVRLRDRGQLRPNPD